MLTRLISSPARLPLQEQLKRGNGHDSGAVLARQCGSHPDCRAIGRNALLHRFRVGLSKNANLRPRVTLPRLDLGNLALISLHHAELAAHYPGALQLLPRHAGQPPRTHAGVCGLLCGLLDALGHIDLEEFDLDGHLFLQVQESVFRKKFF
jgi:hypothetical protein